MMGQRFFGVGLWLALLWQGGLPGKCPAQNAQATPAESLKVHPGFRVELLHSAQPGEGSWISMTWDDRGRLIVARDDRGLLRMTLGDSQVRQIETIDDTLQHCRGVLYAHGSLYVCATNSKGFYRLRDTTGDDRFDEKTLLKPLPYESRFGHGTNQVVLGPDGMLYLVNGDDVRFVEGVSPESPYGDPREDRLLSDPRDPTSDPRTGYILRTDPEGKQWEVLAGGFRNQFDIAFNADGEMFTYDADMEWDVGLPWYRPTHISHIVPGGEYGWRFGTANWPYYFPDGLPAMLDIGLGSPTGLTFGTRSNFPGQFRQALYLGEWQNGRIFIAHLKPRGATYECRYGTFVEGAPLNVCDLEFGPDGALYFITGGRGSQSGLYRVTFVGPPPAEEPPSPQEQQAVEAARASRALRRQLEALQRRRDPSVVEEAWPHLDSDDRWIRYAARLAIERQDAVHWRQRALGEPSPRAAIEALVALARQGDRADQVALAARLNQLPLESLPRETLLAALRVYQLSFLRQGRPQPDVAEAVRRRIDGLYPHASRFVNQELCDLLVYLQAPDVVRRTMKLLAAAPTQEEQIHYAHRLARHREGWTEAQRRDFLAWLAEARRFRGGRWVDRARTLIREDFLATLSDAERSALAAPIARLDAPLSEEPSGPARPIVRQWKLEDLLPVLDQTAAGRSFEGGRAALAAASCLKCHRIGEDGGAVGPDLTSVGRRFDARAILESILEPAKVIDEKYRLMAYELDDGRVVSGSVAFVDGSKIVVETDALRHTTVEISRASIERSFPAAASPMPAGLMDVLQQEEILDLIAYLRAGGDAAHPAFSAP